ncbi:hypothetical protein PIB30_045801 [Stylosanthes scabra]|uniref:Uncharacterized protein n=1 Tax=Stylosanthes scabra TaxID=79078 RepID=A0ABU6ZF09_9FABA|nr:hypothetical protein [Stylosanthes scabra]
MRGKEEVQIEMIKALIRELLQKMKEEEGLEKNCQVEQKSYKKGEEKSRVDCLSVTEMLNEMEQILYRDMGADAHLERDENRFLSRDSRPGDSPQRPGGRITHSEPIVSDPRLGVLPTRLSVPHHIELSKQPRLGVWAPRRPFLLGLMKTSSFQRSSVQLSTPSVSCSASQDSKQRLGVWHQRPSVAVTVASSNQKKPTLRRQHTCLGACIKALTKQIATPSARYQRSAWELFHNSTS